ncbi:MAG: DUF3368 domain-containing protein [Bacteroidales bacterium]
MKIVVGDTGALLSLIHIDQLDLIENIFGEFYIAEAVWIELNNYDNPDFNNFAIKALEPRIVKIHSRNHLSMVMDYGESESVILFEELNADYLLIDDNKARLVAESLNVNCIGTLGLLLKAKQKGLIKELKPLFYDLLMAGRFFSINLLNEILNRSGESNLKIDNR